MARKRYWMAGAAVVAALAAIPLTQAGQASAQQTKVQVQAAVAQPSAQPQPVDRNGRPVRVVYTGSSAAR